MSSTNYLQTEWFILKGENKFGPFDYRAVVKMLQDKVVYEFDFVWCDGMEGWQRIAEIECFGQEHIRGLQKEKKTNAEIFNKRHHPRATFETLILGHDNRQIWKGKSTEISAGGAGIVMENALVVPGQTVHVHFKPISNLPAFNAVCEVVSKKFMSGLKSRTTPLKYGLKFTDVTEETMKLIEKYVDKNAAA